MTMADTTSRPSMPDIMATPALPAPAPSYAEIAVELHLAAGDAAYNQMSFACLLEAAISSQTRTRLFAHATQMGLSVETAARILDSWELRHRLIGEACEHFKSLIPHQDLIAKLIAATKKDQQ